MKQYGEYNEDDQCNALESWELKEEKSLIEADEYWDEEE